ncbi:hypothetical protein Tco_1295687, partial [Tanacetum coccineum]
DESSDDDYDDDDDDDVEEDEDEEHLAPALYLLLTLFLQLRISMSDIAEALIAEYASAPTPPSPSPPPSLLSPLSSPLPQIPSPPLPLPSPPTTSPTYVEAPLGYRAARIRLRATSPSTYHLSEIPSPPLFEVGESSSAAVRLAGHTSKALHNDYGFIDTIDADDWALLGAQVSILRRERRYFRLMAYFYERESVIAQQAWSHSKISGFLAMEGQD